MTSFKKWPWRRLANTTAGEPPHTVDPESVRARGYRRQKRRRIAISACAAAVVAGAVAIPVALTSAHHLPLPVASGGSSPTVIASPSDRLRNAQTIQVTVKGFPAGQKVNLAECPSFRMPRNTPCSRAPAQTVLTTNRSGSATGRFEVEYARAAFFTVFGQPKCGPTCLLAATSTTSPAVSATTVLSFASLATEPPPPTKMVEPPGFGVSAASFITADRGWALGSTGCPGCAGVATTSDGGKTWTSLPAPPTSLWWYYYEPSAVTNIDFANTSDGYLFTPGLYATTDGGHTWTDQHLTGVKSLTVAAGYAYALTGHNGGGPETLYRSRLASNSWRAVPLPVVPTQAQSFEMAAAGPDLVLLQNGSAAAVITPRQVGRLWVSTDAGNDWQPRSVPCTVADGGASVLSVAYGHPQAWLIVCFNNRQSQQLQNTLQHIYGTDNGGMNWVRLGNPPQHNRPALLADNGSGHAFLATEGGSGDTLNGTLDGSRTWTAIIRDGGSFSGWSDLGFATTETGYVVGPSRSATDHLYRTVDGGRTWTTVNVTP